MLVMIMSLIFAATAAASLPPVAATALAARVDRSITPTTQLRYAARVIEYTAWTTNTPATLDSTIAVRV